MAKRINDKWLQVGNFLLGVDKNRNGQYAVCKSVADNWRLTWRDDTLMFAMMVNLMKRAVEDDNAKEYLHSLVTMMFITTTYLHDLVALSTKQQMPFCEGIAKLLAEQTDYEQSLEQKPTDDEEKEALDETARMREVEEELEKLDAENGTD